jgi:hypothetical protein
MKTGILLPIRGFRAVLVNLFSASPRLGGEKYLRCGVGCAETKERLMDQRTFEK